MAKKKSNTLDFDSLLSGACLPSTDNAPRNNFSDAMEKTIAEHAILILQITQNVL